MVLAHRVVAHHPDRTIHVAQTGDPFEARRIRP